VKVNGALVVTGDVCSSGAISGVTKSRCKNVVVGKWKKPTSGKVRPSSVRVVANHAEELMSAGGKDERGRIPKESPPYRYFDWR
jgi:hypothetical protein